MRVRARKTGHGALLPLTAEVGTALAGYLRDGRPGTPSREVFALHWLREPGWTRQSAKGDAMDLRGWFRVLQVGAVTVLTHHLHVSAPALSLYGRYFMCK